MSMLLSAVACGSDANSGNDTTAGGDTSAAVKKPPQSPHRSKVSKCYC